MVDFEALGERSVYVDCDVLQADGGTRCAAITGGYVALRLALAEAGRGGELEREPLTGSVAAVSCGIVDGEALCDLDYSEDSSAEVDANVVMTGDGGLVEVQATAERTPLSRASLDELLGLAEPAIARLRRGPGGSGRRRRRGLMPAPRAVVATRNEHKLRELREILGSLELEPLPDEVELPPEDGRDLRRQRAGQGARGPRGDRPGGDRRRLGDRGARARRAPRGPLGPLRAARGERRGEPASCCCASSTARDDRRAAYVCALAYVDEDGAEHVFEGRCEGVLAREPRGAGGFGYDPAFVPDDTGPDDERTMAELEPGGEARDQPPRAAPRRLLAAPGWSGERMIRTKSGRGDALDRLQLAADRAQARGRGDHRLDRDHHRGGPLARSTWSPR